MENNSNNPMLRQKAFENAARGYYPEAMTRNGAFLKTFFLFLILLAGASVSWIYAPAVLASPVLWVGALLAGTGLSFFTIFVPKAAPVTAPIYAFAEGFVLGAVSCMYQSFYGGIVLEAVLITGAIFLVTLVFYRAGIVKVTNRFRMGVLIATLGVGIVYLASLVLSLFGRSISFLNSTGLLGIGISLVIIVIASLNFLLDFDYIDRAASAGAPKYMEWYLGFSLMLTFVWLYLEVLRLLSKLQRFSR